jgi:beta-alanine degradation protein BauB
MKKLMLVMLSVITIMTFVGVQATSAQDKKQPWPGVTVKVLTDNDKVKISEATFAPGAVADWHSHPQHTVYAITDLNLKVEMKEKEASRVEMKAGQAMWSPAVTHKITNVGKNTLTMIVTEIK